MLSTDGLGHVDRSDSFVYDSFEEEATMQVEKVEIKDGKLMLSTGEREVYLPDGTYRSEDGATITVAGSIITDALIPPDFQLASKQEIETYISELRQKLSSVGEDAQLANVDLQNMLQKQQQTVQMLSNISKVLHDTALAVIRKVG
jgi:hypothetical protein